MAEYTVTVDGDLFEIEIGPGGQTWINRQPYEVDLCHVGGNGSTLSAGEYSLLVDNRSYEVHVADVDNEEQWVTVGGRPYHTRLLHGPSDRRRPGDRGNGRAATSEDDCGAQPEPSSHTEVRAPLPGLLVELCVREDEPVREQQVVAVLESMKMNLEVRAPRDGVVRDLCVAPGHQVAQDEVLAVLGANGVSSDS